MTRISVDDKVSEVSNLPNGIGNLIQDTLASIPPNRIVTQILLDGKRIQSHLMGETSEAELGEVKALDIKTVDREVWAINGIDIALSALERVKPSLLRVAELFREENKGRANQNFVQCIDGLEKFFEAMLITRVALKLDFKKISLDGIPLSQLESDFSDVLKNIVHYQEKADYDSVADKVEYELITNLHTWTKVLKQLRNSQNSNA